MKLDFRDVSMAVYIIWAGLVTSRLWEMWRGEGLFNMVLGLIIGAFGPMIGVTFVWWYLHRDAFAPFPESEREMDD